LIGQSWFENKNSTQIGPFVGIDDNNSHGVKMKIKYVLKLSRGLRQAGKTEVSEVVVVKYTATLNIHKCTRKHQRLKSDLLNVIQHVGSIYYFYFPQKREKESKENKFVDINQQC
jgi:hypothetical protein